MLRFSVNFEESEILPAKKWNSRVKVLTVRLID